eukprot:365600-Chlamydomonas_euryale.AAC.2
MPLSRHRSHTAASESVASQPENAMQAILLLRGINRDRAALGPGRRSGHVCWCGHEAQPQPPCVWSAAGLPQCVCRCEVGPDILSDLLVCSHPCGPKHALCTSIKLATATHPTLPTPTLMSSAVYREQGVNVQIGGSDQWGNITAGTDLVRRMLGGEEGSGIEAPSCYGLTFPLLVRQHHLSQTLVKLTQMKFGCSCDNAPHVWAERVVCKERRTKGWGPCGYTTTGWCNPTVRCLVDSEGRKFGKSVGGAIWLAADKLTPYKFYQYLFAVTDTDVVKFLKMLTFLDLAEIDAIQASMSEPGYKPNMAQKRLAEEVTRFVHGEEGLAQALATTEALKPGSSTKLDAASLEAVSEGAPSASLPRDAVVGVPLVDIMAQVKLQPSKGAGRK